ncbi:uncharacterized protein At2g34160-like [Macadamia integrifolia]|uniref:uncharacterized protein At2g34160-like n=1 Tax=Macadamia integrifolia TaxID=60698 RepID=UPI001C4FE8EF|nr:uncharacterized protein At2g34160-like [Macadamia integrifolia]
MEVVAVADAGAGAIAKAKLGGGPERQRTNKIQVSSTKRPLYFYVNLAKRCMQQHEEVELSALGMAITTVVTIAEILKNNGLATQKKIMTSTVGMKDESKGRLVQKAKIEILMAKTGSLDNMLTAKTITSEAATDGKETLLAKTESLDNNLTAKTITSEAAADAKEEGADGKEILPAKPGSLDDKLTAKTITLEADADAKEEAAADDKEE